MRSPRSAAAQKENMMKQRTSGARPPHGAAESKKPAATLGRRGLRPAAELAAGRSHGDRVRYIAGCRCDDCRQANTAYERARQAARKAGDWNGLVPADRAREHLVALSSKGVGRNSVAHVTGIARSTLWAVITGEKRRLRARSERAILAVTVEAAADRALVDAAPTWRFIEQMLADGYTKTRLARELGCKTAALQIGRKQVTVRTAFEVQKLYGRLRCCCAREMQRLLAELRAEGFRQSRIDQELQRLAAQRGVAVPDLAVRNRRVHFLAEDLVREVHQRLLE
jgi:hypothetical protein